MSATGDWAKDTAREHSTTRTAASTRASGRKTSSMGREPSPSRTVPSTLGPSRTTEWSTGRSLRRMQLPSPCRPRLEERTARLARRTPKGQALRKEARKREQTRVPQARVEGKVAPELPQPLVRAASEAPLQASLPLPGRRRRLKRTLSAS